MKNILFRQVYFSDIYSVQSVILILKVFDLKAFSVVFPKTGHFITAWEVNMLEQHNYLKEYLFFKGFVCDIRWLSPVVSQSIKASACKSHGAGPI